MLTEARSRGGLASVPLEDPNSNAAIGDLNGKDSADARSSQAHFNTWLRSSGIYTLAFVIGIIVTIAIPSIFLAKQYQLCPEKMGDEVNKSGCTCSCWDGKFKGCYGRRGYVGAEYRSLYFNLTPEMLEIYSMSIVFFVVLSHAIKDIIVLLLSHPSELRYPMMVALIATIIPQFYAWWTHLNYINDGLYYLRATQLWFTLTESVNSFIFFIFMDKRRPVPSTWIIIGTWVTLTISGTHIMISMRNLLENISIAMRLSRDLLLVGNDLLSIVCGFALLLATYNTNPHIKVSWKRHLGYAAMASFALQLWFYKGIASSF